jgi:hypothetical protein
MAGKLNSAEHPEGVLHQAHLGIAGPMRHSDHSLGGVVKSLGPGQAGGTYCHVRVGHLRAGLGHAQLGVLQAISGVGEPRLVACHACGIAGDGGQRSIDSLNGGLGSGCGVDASIGQPKCFSIAGCRFERHVLRRPGHSSDEHRNGFA